MSKLSGSMFPSLKTVALVEEEISTPTGRKTGEVVFLRRRHKEQGDNLTEPMDFMVMSSILTGKECDMHNLSCPSQDPTGTEVDYLLSAQQEDLRSLLFSIITKL